MNLFLLLFWSVFLSVILALAFYRSWRAEHKKREIVMRGNTAVWNSPLILPGMLLVYVLISVIAHGKRGLQEMFYVSMEIFLFLSIYYVLLMLLLPALRKRYSARACATLWMVPVLLYYQVNLIVTFAIRPLFTIAVPKNLPGYALILWGIGFGGVLCWQILLHFQFRNYLMKHSEKITDLEMEKLLISVCEGMEMHLGIKLRYCEAVKTPLAMGAFKANQILFLPEKGYSREELELIFSHEVHHLQRCDVEMKMFLGFCQAFCWFNPLVWIAVDRASEDLELSCDEIVLLEADEKEREQYARLLLKTAGNAKGYSTCLSGKAKALRYRLKNVVQPGKRNPGVLFLALVMFVSCMCNGQILFAEQKESIETLYHSKEYVLENMDGIYLIDAAGNTILDAGDDPELCEKILEELDGLKVEKLLTLREFELYDTMHLSIYLKDGSNMILTNDMAELDYYSDDDVESNGNEWISERLGYYCVKSDLDLNELYNKVN